MAQFAPAKEISEMSGVPMRVLGQMAAQGRFSYMRPTKHLLMIHVEEFRACMESTLNKQQGFLSL